jgi:hypothetical protein
MALVRLRRKKWAEKDEKRPAVDAPAGLHDSDNLPGMAAVYGFPTADQARKRMSRLGRLAEGEEPGSNILFCYFKGL